MVRVRGIAFLPFVLAGPLSCLGGVSSAENLPDPGASARIIFASDTHWYQHFTAFGTDTLFLFDLINEFHPQVWVTPGDLSYNADTVSHDAGWVDTALAHAPAYCPWLVGVGNHDGWIKGRYSGECATAADSADVFLRFRRKFGLGEHTWYSRKVGNVLIIMLNNLTNTESDTLMVFSDTRRGTLYVGCESSAYTHNYPPYASWADSGSAQWNFLEKELKRTDVDHRIVCAHFPFYPVTGNSSRPWHAWSHHLSGGRTHTVMDLMEDLGCDAFIAGHHHAYLRTNPIHDNAVVAGGTANDSAMVHFIVGQSGGPGHTVDFGGYPDILPQEHTAASHFDGENRIFVLELETSEAVLHFRYREMRTRRVVDEVVIDKGR